MPRLARPRQLPRTSGAGGREASGPLSGSPCPEAERRRRLPLLHQYVLLVSQVKQVKSSQVKSRRLSFREYRYARRTQHAFVSKEKKRDSVLFTRDKETDEETTRADTATHEARALPVDGAGALGARVAAPAAYPGRIIVDARAPPPLFIRVFPELCPPSTRFFPYFDFGLALPADAPTGQGARAATKVRHLLREMLRVPRDVLQLRVLGENQED